MSVMERVYLLMAGKGRMHALVLPETVSFERVTAAWSYAIRYSAKGLDLPDYEGAIKLLKQRHPTWEVLETRATQVTYNGAMADQDIPDVR